ncbi:hypothetical protein LTR27_004846 [Elasticomyces elasticus]|nr:hypothetical protein LTR27_004846 [Elasticomyces elasticus]
MSTTGNANSAESYTVAWITALSNERAAGESMFDAKHDSAPQDFRRNTSDPNAYSWGKIGVHNVVIASLPAGKYGTNAVATIAQGLISSLPHIRVGLLVGVGAGILGELRTKEVTPEARQDTELEVRHKIQLGDVAVSVPKGTTGGVVQFDLAKVQTVEGQEKITRIGWLNSPPIAVRTALTKLQAQHDLEDSKVAALIEQAFERYPKLRTKYSHPGQRTVPKADTYHPRHGPAVAREARGIPEIHYGVIASSNTLVKSAQYRDDMLRDLGSEGVDPICIEMEAAGLMNSFPCLVIRGICDYADEHKNDDWQAYAAIAAAAYAKEFLQCVDAMDIRQEPGIGEILDQTILHAHRSTKLMRIVIPVVKHIGEKTTFVAKSIHEGRIRAWLAPADPSTNYNQACELRHPDTGRWFLDGEQYRRLKTLKNAALWLRGGSGCGKTVLSSAIISDLRNDAKSETSVTVYFFFDINDPKKQSVEGMLRSLIFQLYQQAPASRAHLEKIHGGEQAQIQTLLAVWTVMCSAVDEVSVMIDALDECKSREDLLRRLPSVKCEHVRLLITSRPEYEIEVSFQRWIPEHDVVSVQRAPVDNDIRQVIRSHIYTDVGPLSRWKGKIGVLALIEDRLMKKAKGMFRWAICQLDALQDCLSMDEIEDTLRALPKDLTETYARILQKVSERRRPRTILLLQFLLHARRPLRLEEAVDAIAVSPDRTPAFEPNYRMPVPQEIARLCSSLTRVVTSKGNDADWDVFSDPMNGEEWPEVVSIQLAHASVNDFLASELVPADYQGCFGKDRASAAIHRVCTAYLLTAAQPLRGVECRPGLPFTVFCALRWLRHIAEMRTQDLIAGVRRTANCAWVMESFGTMERCVYWLNRYDRDTSESARSSPPCEGENNDHAIVAPLSYAALSRPTAPKSLLSKHEVDVHSKMHSPDSAVTVSIWFASDASLQSLVDHAGGVGCAFPQIGPTSDRLAAPSPPKLGRSKEISCMGDIRIVISHTPAYSSFVTWLDRYNKGAYLLLPMSVDLEAIHAVHLSTLSDSFDRMSQIRRSVLAAALACAYFQCYTVPWLRHSWPSLHLHPPTIPGTSEKSVDDMPFVVSRPGSGPTEMTEWSSFVELALMLLCFGKESDDLRSCRDPLSENQDKDNPVVRRAAAVTWHEQSQTKYFSRLYRRAVRWLLYEAPKDSASFSNWHWRTDFALEVIRPLLSQASLLEYRRKSVGGRW